MTAASDPLRIVIAAAGGYLVGSLPVGLLVSRAARGLDIRAFGSGATGATNVLRVHGWRLALPVLAADVAKGAIAAWAGAQAGGGWAGSAAALGAVVGHVLPVWTRFRGGKGVAVSAGAAAVLAPAALAAGLVGFAAALAASRRVSVASLVAAATLGGWTVAAGSAPVATFGAAAAAVVALAHAPNVARLARGEEPRIGRYARDQRAPDDDGRP